MTERTAAPGPDYSWGPQKLDDGRWRFRLWAPGVDDLTLSLRGETAPMDRHADGWHSSIAPAAEGDTYAFVLPDGLTVPDPAARRQLSDVHGASLLTAPRTAPPPPGRPWEEAVIHEIHIGTFTREGTFRAAAREMAGLADLGFTCVEIMPVAQFGGDRGWGYDGVLPFAPHPAYGTPGDLAALVEAAHAAGLMVLLDVVYNHFGPDGNYLGAYAPDFFDPDRHTPWGAGIDYTKAPVRRFFIENALYWLTEFGFDGLRLDAIDQIRDPSDPDLLVELAQELRATLPGRHIHLTTEDNRNITRLHERGPDGDVTLHTAEWNDDLHNAAHVAVTGETEGYYEAYAGDPWGMFGTALAEGFCFKGQGGRGEPSGHMPPAAFVDFIQNHDQIGNRACGDRLCTLVDDDTCAALHAILFLSPHIPLVFQGDEYGERHPFLFFAGFEGDLAKAVTEGRRREFEGFTAFAGQEVPDPIDRSTFEMSRLDRRRRDTPVGRQTLERTRRLLHLRAERIVPHLAGTGPNSGRLLLAEGGRLAVDWQLNGALLSLRAAFHGGGADLPPAEGRELHRLGDPDAQIFVRHSLKVG